MSIRPPAPEWKKLIDHLSRMEAGSGSPMRPAEISDDTVLPPAQQSLLNAFIRNKRLIDHLIGHFCPRPPKGRLLHLLQAGIADLLDPGSADTADALKVHHAVEQVKAMCSERETGFANAVLRRASLEHRSICEKLENQGSWALRFSHPDWLVDRWIRDHGKEKTRQLLEWNQEPPSHYAHDWRGGLSPEEAAQLALEPSPWPGFFRLRGPIQPLLDRGLYLQDPSTRMAAALAGERISGRALDACAAPGGKTLHLIRRADPDATLDILAVDLSAERMKRFESNRKRLGWEGVQTRLLDWMADPSPPDDLKANFDLVFLDAPCSSCGVMRRHPEIRWRLTREDFRRMPELQLNLLKRVSACVRPEGRLIYSTCSFDASENEAVWKSFLESAEGQAFEWVENCKAWPPEAGHDGVGAALFRRRN
jgi:16S rRNA (cytosine967-C5)-methyltransferase